MEKTGKLEGKCITEQNSKLLAIGVEIEGVCHVIYVSLKYIRGEQPNE